MPLWMPPLPLLQVGGAIDKKVKQHNRYILYTIYLFIFHGCGGSVTLTATPEISGPTFDASNRGVLLLYYMILWCSAAAIAAHGTL